LSNPRNSYFSHQDTKTQIDTKEVYFRGKKYNLCDPWCLSVFVAKKKLKVVVALEGFAKEVVLHYNIGYEQTISS
jgi:hypothetical protein